MMAPTAAGKLPDNNAARAGEELCSTPHFVESGKWEFCFPKTLALLSSEMLIWETYFHASHFQFTYLFVSSNRRPSFLQLQGFKTTLINTCAHTHSAFLFLPFSLFLMHTNLWGQIVEAEKRWLAQANEGWQDVYVTPKPSEPEAIKGLARLTQASQLQWPVLGELVLKWGAAASFGPNRTLSQLSLLKTGYL